ncbi:hypothetical protein LCGC14_2883260 [marine sediment metagenome]|uniref:Uncharacterized protein n=1 Tax=marine sediment metagenome TaxID=412755 RepID=A0A0F8XZG8_9ZZZZ
MLADFPCVLEQGHKCPHQNKLGGRWNLDGSRLPKMIRYCVYDPYADLKEGERISGGRLCVCQPGRTEHAIRLERPVDAEHVYVKRFGTKLSQHGPWAQCLRCDGWKDFL